MLPIDIRIHRAQRLIRMLEEDVPLLAVRVSELTPEHQRSAQNCAAWFAANARAELDRLLQHESNWDSNDPTPEAAD